MSYLINEEFAQALNPLYAFPIVAVILCAFIVYAFGFKSPVQPPSFEKIEEQVKKVSKKRKTKESSKVNIVFIAIYCIQLPINVYFSFLIEVCNTICKYHVLCATYADKYIVLR